jgi:hypothetical protein
MPTLSQILAILPAPLQTDSIKETAAPILAEIIDAYHSMSDFIDDDEEPDENSDYLDNRSEIFDALESLDCGEDDFTLDFDGNEYRIIKDSAIWEIYRDEIENIVTECYDLKLDSLPPFIAVSIDWEETAQNAYADGYGHTFASYDGDEREAADHWIFRTN